MNIPLILAITFGLLVVALLLGIFIFHKRREEKFTPNYRALFTMGIIWLGAGIPLGISTENNSLWVMGLVFFLIGLANRDKWADEVAWSDLSQADKRIKLALIVGLTVLLIAGAAFMFLLRANS